MRHSGVCISLDCTYLDEKIKKRANETVSGVLQKPRNPSTPPPKIVSDSDVIRCLYAYMATPIDPTLSQFVLYTCFCNKDVFDERQ